MFCQLNLTCASKKEADKITKSLLEKRLVACAKQAPVESSSWWNDKIENTDEILLIMESREDFFNEVEKVVSRLHSYDTFVLSAIPITKISNKAEVWLEETLKNE